MVRLAQVAGGTTDLGRQGDPVAVGQVWREHLEQTDHVLATPATARAMQNARKAGPTSRAARRSGDRDDEQGRRIVPADDSASVHGTATAGAPR